MAHYGAPRLTIAAINGHRIEWVEGHGVMEVGGSQPVETLKLVQATSISKAPSGVREGFSRRMCCLRAGSQRSAGQCRDMDGVLARGIVGKCPLLCNNETSS